MSFLKTAWENAWVRVGATAAVVVMAFGCWYVLYLQPARAQLAHLRQKQRVLQAGMREMARAELQIRSLRRQTDSLKVALHRVQTRLADVGALQKLIQRLAVRGRRAGLNFVAVTPDYTSLLVADVKGPVQALPITVEAEGRFLALGHFLEGLKQMPFYFEPTGLGLNYDPALYPRLKIRLKGKLYLRGSSSEAGPVARQVLSRKS